MPRSVFPATTFSAATPGMSRLAASLAGGSSTFDKARDNEVMLQSRLAQAIAGIDAHNAAAAASRARAAQDDVETGIIRGRGDVGDELLAADAQTTVPIVRAWRDGLRTGNVPVSSATGDPDTDTLIGIAPSPVVESKVADLLRKLAPRYATYRTSAGKDMNAENLAKAGQVYRDADLSDSIIAGALPRDTVAGAQAAVGGKPMFAQNGNGSVLDRFEGTVDQDNPIARATISERSARAGQADEAGLLSRARRERVEGGYGNAPVTVVDEDTGDASVTRLPTGGDPVTVGVAPKKGTGVDATLQKERNRVTRDVERDLPGANDAEISAEVERRMSRRTGKPAPVAAPAKPAGAAPMNPTQRKAGEVYNTPRGPMKWTGTGWLPAN